MIGMRVSIDNQFHFQFMPPDELLKQFVVLTTLNVAEPLSKSRTGSMMAHARLAGSQTMYCTDPRRLMEYAVNVWSHQSPAAFAGDRSLAS